MAKKRSWVTRLVLWFFRMIGKAVGGIFALIASAIVGTKHIAEVSHKEHIIRQGKAYNIPAKDDELTLVKTVSGQYKTFSTALHRKSLIMLIFGKRGSGKSALGFRILENIHATTNRACYVLGVEQQLLPKWIGSIETIEDATNGSVILVDEGAVSFGSRSSMSKHNRELARIMAVARHKDLTLIFITQNTGMIDKNVLKLSDTLLVKEGSLLQLEMERPEIRNFYAKAKPYFDKVSKKIAHVYIIDSEFEGMLSARIPSFWSETISKNQGI